MPIAGMRVRSWRTRVRVKKSPAIILLAWNDRGCDYCASGDGGVPVLARYCWFGVSSRQAVEIEDGEELEFKAGESDEVCCRANGKGWQNLLASWVGGLNS